MSKSKRRKRYKQQPIIPHQSSEVVEFLHNKISAATTQFKDLKSSPSMDVRNANMNGDRLDSYFITISHTLWINKKLTRKYSQTLGGDIYINVESDDFIIWNLELHKTLRIHEQICLQELGIFNCNFHAFGTNLECAVLLQIDSFQSLHERLCVDQCGHNLVVIVLAGHFNWTPLRSTGWICHLWWKKEWFYWDESRGLSIGRARKWTG